ncbi:hypothetical protein ACK3TF_005258 [Chlorella vulgaris]
MARLAAAAREVAAVAKARLPWKCMPKYRNSSTASMAAPDVPCCLQLGPEKMAGNRVVGLLEVDKSRVQRLAARATALNGGSQHQGRLGAVAVAAEAKLALSAHARQFGPSADAVSILGTGVIALTAQHAGRQPTRAHALNKPVRTGATAVAVCFKTTGLSGPTTAARFRICLIR